MPEGLSVAALTTASEFRRLVERYRLQGRWVRRVRPVPCPAVDPTARTFGRLFRPILLIPSWEGLRADPEEKRGSCERHQRQIDGRAGKRLTLTRPNREGTGKISCSIRLASAGSQVDTLPRRRGSPAGGTGTQKLAV